MKLLFVDDHEGFRESLSNSLITEFNLHQDDILHATNLAEAMSIASKITLDLILLDIELSDVCGAVAVNRLRPFCQKILVYSAHQKYVDKTKEAGALGFIYKGESLATLYFGIRQVLNNEYYFCPSNSIPNPDTFTTPSKLTPIELKVLNAISKNPNVKNKVIADQLHISTITLSNHLRTIFRILGVENKTQAIEKAKELGLLSDDD